MRTVYALREGSGHPASKVQTVSGEVSAFWPGHHGDWPEFELLEVNGAISKWGCHMSAEEAAVVFTVGTDVEVDFVPQHAEQQLGGSYEINLTVAIRVGI